MNPGPGPCPGCSWGTGAPRFGSWCSRQPKPPGRQGQGPAWSCGPGAGPLSCPLWRSYPSGFFWAVVREHPTEPIYREGAYPSAFPAAAAVKKWSGVPSSRPQPVRAGGPEDRSNQESISSLCSISGPITSRGSLTTLPFSFMSKTISVPFLWGL